MRKFRLAMAWMLWLFATAAMAAAPADDLSFSRRRWTLADGAPDPSLSMAQTADGLMWFASPGGLYNFDGRRFHRETSVYGHALLSPNVYSILGLPHGGLAVGYMFGGVSILTPQGGRHFVAGRDFPLGTVKFLTADPQGHLYAATTSGVVQQQGERWLPVGAGLPTAGVDEIGFDRDGTLWVMYDEEIYARRAGAAEFGFVTRYAAGRANFFQGYLLAKLPDGDFVRLCGGTPPQRLKLDQAARYSDVLDGPNGTVVALRENGIARLAQRADGSWHETAYYPPLPGGQAGGAGESLRTMLDREGNLWQTTYEGVEKLRLHRFHQLQAPGILWLAQAGLDGEIWAGSYFNPMLRLKPDGAMQPTRVVGAGVILKAGPQRVWVAARNGLWRFDGEVEQRWDFPEGLGRRFDVQAMAQQADGTLLVAIARNGLWRFDGKRWRRDPRLDGQQDATPISMLTDAGGRTWVALTNNRLGVLTPAALRLLPAASQMRLGNILSMVDIGGRLLAGGDAGVAWIDGQTVHPLHFAGRDGVQRVTGLVTDNLDQLWVHGNDGLLRVPAEALRQFWQAPGQPVTAELFNFEDGVSGTAAALRPLPSLGTDGAGRVYYATTSQVGWIDAARIRRNPRAPDVIIQSLRTPAGELRPLDGMTLAGQPTAIDIAFAATALAIPERAALKYRLEGVDADWREVRQERGAHYTNLAPGRYRFQVIAANEDGVWNMQGAALRFEIAPAFWQTWWFRGLCALLLVLALAALYRWRIAVVERHAGVLAEARAAARLAATRQERGRIARSLHDNLLQSAQALILQFRALQNRMPPEPALQAKMEQVLGFAKEMVESTRDEVVALRRDPSGHDLLVKLREALAAAMPGAEQMLVCAMVGVPRLLHEEVRNEVFAVLREAVWNSARHAGAHRISVRLRFGDQALEGEVLDDGCGICSEVGRSGAPGRWGIVGMRERIQRLGGGIDIVPGEGGHGVSVQFSIPAARAYPES
ncbi:sensor histidine kinase [Duganella callida]|uniref:Histidine kinase/HSP90-like ATPase domain-containing protein n=1 Tax=Duganella callida TaxID=2561932 RepID=A0A4Y9SQW1_9BURK|nr:sensor histidine kinase [Duganella callida]TFW27624.1 hypothetical protein E4L98_06605 [Duganella callida]